MISLALMAAGLLAASDTADLAVERLAPDAVQTDALAPPVKIWINSSGQFREGEKARVQVESADDGYLLVLNYDTDGRLRVLFPVDPRDDNFVQGGRRYEVRGRGERESFMVGRDGNGLVYAAISADPFRLDDFDNGGNWDYSRLSIGDDARDAEADITDLLQSISTSRGFDYDLLDYRVYNYNSGYTTANSWWYPRPYGYWDDYYCDPWYRTSLFGCRYYPVRGWYLGYGGYGRYYGGWGYGGGYYGYPRYRNNYRYPYVVGRPRGYTIVRRGANGNVGRDRFGGTMSGSLPRGLGTDRGTIYRPRGNSGRSRPDGDRIDGTPGNSPRNMPADGSRSRGRRAQGTGNERPNIEREVGGRGSVDFGGEQRGRRVRGNDEGDRRPASQPEARNEGRGRRSGGDEPRGERSAPRSERPQASPPRSEPKQSPPPSNRSNGGDRGGGGGSHRPRGGRPPA